MTNCLFTACLQLLLGGSYETNPPNGTWYQAEKPHSFRNEGVAYGVTLVGSNWSVSAERLGRMTSSAIACGADEPACRDGRVPYSHWYGVEHPYGIWAAYEPHWGPAFAQIGVGVARSGFAMNIPDWTDGTVKPHQGLRVDNTQTLVSPLAGIGYRTPVAELIFNYRLLRTENVHVGSVQTQYQGLGWGVFSLSLRSEF
jgi:hypothetical protein